MSNVLDSFGDGKTTSVKQAFGRISRVTADGVYAIVPSFDPTNDYGPMHFEHEADAAVGDAVLVAFDEQGNPWLVSWRGTIASALDPHTMHVGDAAGGVLAGTYPDPSFAVDMATQAELDAAITGLSATYETIAHAASTYAPLASPTFTGDPKAPTPSTGDNDTSIATTAFVKAQGYETTAHAASTYAPLASPALTGSPTAPTPSGGDNDTSIATTAFVQGELAAKAPLASPALTGNPTAPTPSANDADTSIATTAFADAIKQAALAIPVLRAEFGGTFVSGTVGSYFCNMDSQPKAAATLSNYHVMTFQYAPNIDAPPSGYKTQWKLDVVYKGNATSTAMTWTWSLWQITAATGGAGGFTETGAGSFLSALSVAIAGSANALGRVESAWADHDAANSIATGAIYGFGVNLSSGMAGNSAFSWTGRLYRRFVPV